jgi:hypothetical protein
VTGRDDELAALAALLRSQRWAALATLEADGQPYASAVAYVAEPHFAGLLLHLSLLAPHTRNLLADPRASLVISEGDSGMGDPQSLARLSLLGRVSALDKAGAAYATARAHYLARLPDAERLFGFSDFQLFRFTPGEARFVGGFARARRFGPEALRQAAGL